MTVNNLLTRTAALCMLGALSVAAAMPVSASLPSAPPAPKDTVLFSSIPMASDPDAGNTLSYRINTTPTWATFNTATDELSGTPVSGDIGTTTSGIIIIVSDAARRFGCFDEACAHMLSDAEWTKAQVLADAAKYQFHTPFAKHSPGAYSAAKQNGWHDEACAHMSSYCKWTDADLSAIAAQHRTKSEFKDNDFLAYMSAGRRGLDTQDLCAYDT